MVAFVGYHSRVARLFDDTGNGVLRYHSVGGGFYDSISPDRLRRDLEYLQRRCEIVDLPEVLRSDGAKRIALTFDDGYRDFYRNVVPILQEYDVPATVFVATDTIDDPSSDHKMGREELEALVEDDLVTIGNHTQSHPDLSKLSREEIEREIIGAQERLEALLGTDVRRFSYPYSRFEDRAVEVVGDTHDIGVGGRGRRETVSADTDPAAVPRVDGGNPFWEVRWDLSRPATLLGSACDRFMGSETPDTPGDRAGGDDEQVVDGDGPTTGSSDRRPRQRHRQ